MIKTIQQKLDEGRQYRSVVEIRANEDEKIVEGYASTFNQPYELFSFDKWTVREQVDPHAFDGCDLSDVIMQYDHQGRVFARGSNDTLTVEPDENGLHIRADLGGTEIGRNLYEEIKGGYTTKMSFGFIVEADTRSETEDETGHIDVLRTITKVKKVFDVSAVSLPANDGTVITSARSYSEGVIAELEEEFLERAKRERQRKVLKLKTML